MIRNNDDILRGPRSSAVSVNDWQRHKGLVNRCPLVTLLASRTSSLLVLQSRRLSLPHAHKSEDAQLAHLLQPCFLALTTRWQTSPLTVSPGRKPRKRTSRNLRAGAIPSDGVPDSGQSHPSLPPIEELLLPARRDLPQAGSAGAGMYCTCT
jgi:hypothetical protein